MNHLSTASSPYLRQHAHNPVDWRPWGPSALAEARALDRPIFLSVGYAACHWCHVMERESFMDDRVAALMNAWFVNIKVDREERPEVDAWAMDALLAMTGEGGWPLSLWLTPDLAPLQGGTYFPPHPRYGLPGFGEACRRVQEAWAGSRERSVASAEALRARLAAESEPRAGRVPEITTFDQGLSRLLAGYDWRCGGWGSGAKFPQAPRLDLLATAAGLGRPGRAAEALAHALDAIDRGGIHDHLGGGFHRYAVDDDWEVPHFEKMLYDNAQLVRTYLRASSLLGRGRYATVGSRALGWLYSDLACQTGMFYSSLDADDAGGEGAFYTWTPAELKAAVPDLAGALGEAYGVLPGGNAEGGRSTLRRRRETDLLSAARARLLAARARRPRPGLDDKIVLAWNGLALSALATAGRLGDPDALARARRLALALPPAGALPRTMAPDAPAGILDDHALVAEGLLELYEASGEHRWLTRASDLMGLALSRFADPGSGALLLAAPGGHPPPRVLWEEGAEPSGAGVALLTLARLRALDDRALPGEALDRALGCAAEPLARQPEACPTTLRALQLAAGHARTVVISGDPADPRVVALREAALRPWRPDVVVASAAPEVDPEGRFGALAGRQGPRPRAYVCEGVSCSLPVSDPGALSEMLREEAR